MEGTPGKSLDGCLMLSEQYAGTDSGGTILQTVATTAIGTPLRHGCIPQAQVIFIATAGQGGAIFIPTQPADLLSMAGIGRDDVIGRANIVLQNK